MYLYIFFIKILIKHTLNLSQQKDMSYSRILLGSAFGTACTAAVLQSVQHYFTIDGSKTSTGTTSTTASTTTGLPMGYSPNLKWYNEQKIALKQTRLRRTTTIRRS